MNSLQLVADLISRDQLRFTPAGIPIVDCVLQYFGKKYEVGSERQIQFVLNALAAGQCGEMLGKVDLGVSAWFTGFLVQKRRNSQRLVFHITDFQILPRANF